MPPAPTSRCPNPDLRWVCRPAPKSPGWPTSLASAAAPIVERVRVSRAVSARSKRLQPLRSAFTAATRSFRGSQSRAPFFPASRYPEASASGLSEPPQIETAFRRAVAFSSPSPAAITTGPSPPTSPRRQHPAAPSPAPNSPLTPPLHLPASTTPPARPSTPKPA